MKSSHILSVLNGSPLRASENTAKMVVVFFSPWKFIYFT